MPPILSKGRLLALAFAFALAACDSGSPAPASADLLGTLGTQTAFEPFVDAAAEVGLDDALASGGPYTVFAPTATAFDYVGVDILPVLRDPAQRAVFARLLRHHVVAGRIAPEAFVDGDTLRSIDGRPLPVRRIGPVVEIGGVRVRIDEAVDGDNGVAYPVADVMFGAITTIERVRLSPSLATLERLGDQTGVLPTGEVPGGVTLLAPVEGAFRALGGRLSFLQSPANADVLRRVMQATVVPGLPALTPGAPLTTLDGGALTIQDVDGERIVGGRPVLRVEETADGRIVLLGGVVLSPLSLGQRLRIEPLLQQFTRDLRDADPALWARLSSDDEALTLFVPTDAAFNAVDTDVAAALREPINRPLWQHLMRVHVVEGRYAPGDLVDGLDLPTADGYTRRIELGGRDLRYDGRVFSEVEVAESSNGWFYTLGSVVFPAVDGFDTTLLRGFLGHVRAVRRAGLESLFRSPGLTAFPVQDGAYDASPEVFDSPRLSDLLLYNATYTPIPALAPTTFVSVNGYERAIGYFAEPCEGCEPIHFFAEGEYTRDLVVIDAGGPSFDGNSFFHSVRTIYFPR